MCGFTGLVDAKLDADRLDATVRRMTATLAPRGPDAEGHFVGAGIAANIPLYLLARKLRGEIKVVLQGDGGDELFAGYRRYAILRHTAQWRRWPRGLTPVVRGWLGSRGRRAARMADAMAARDDGLRMALLLTVETLAEPPTALLDEGVARLAVRLPSAWKVSRVANKIVLRESQRAGRSGARRKASPSERAAVRSGRRSRCRGWPRARTRAACRAARTRTAHRSPSWGRRGCRWGCGRDRGFTLWKLLQLALWAKVAP